MEYFLRRKTYMVAAILRLKCRKDRFHSKDFVSKSEIGFDVTMERTNKMYKGRSGAGATVNSEARIKACG